MSHVFLTLKLGEGRRDLKRVMKDLSLRSSEVDTQFGLVEISPDENLYTILVEPRAAARLKRAPGVERISGNPTVESMDGDPTA